MSFMESVGGILLVVIVIILITAIQLNNEVNTVCENYEESDASIWDDKITCYNHTIIDGQYTITASEDFIKSKRDN